MSVVSTGKKLRILCLHGHRHNSALMELHMAPLRRALGDSAEFVFMNGVSLARDEPDKVPFYEWYDVRRLEEDEDQDDEWLFQYEGLDDAILYMDEQLQRLGTSDVVLSFAQGVVLMTILSMHYEHKNRGLQASGSGLLLSSGESSAPAYAAGAYAIIRGSYSLKMTLARNCSCRCRPPI